MLQATIYAHRSAFDCIDQSTRTGNTHHHTDGLSLGRLLSFGRRLIGGQPVDVLSDHVLDDIGLSRADLDALTL